MSIRAEHQLDGSYLEMIGMRR